MSETSIGRAVVVGLGVSGVAVARQLRDRGTDVVVIEDSPGSDAEPTASELGAELVVGPDRSTLTRVVAAADVVVPSPGVRPPHPVLRAAAATGVPILSEVELASQWATCPLVAVTGTNGKTTVTSLVAAMATASGIDALACGNIGLALSDAVARHPALLIVEVSSFQLAWTETFRPAVATWLNVAEDHLDWHGDFGAYAAAKARIWANQRPGDVAVVNADDSRVLASAPVGPRVVRFGLGQEATGWHVAGGALRAPGGEELLAVTQLPRALPHDLANALAAAATAVSAGATLDGARAALRSGPRLPHRVALVGDAGGVRWYDDSKATNPHAVLAAVAGFESVVLVAGGHNKGLDLSTLTVAADRLRAVVAIGEAGDELAGAFSGLRPVRRAATMDDAVREAADLAEPGDVVLLSPGCASFDRYRSYAERGDDFARAVGALLQGEAATGAR